MFACLIVIGFHQDLSSFLLSGIALHLHQLITSKSSAFQEESFCTICCKFANSPYILYAILVATIFDERNENLLLVIFTNHQLSHWNYLETSLVSCSSQQKTIINAMAVNEEGVMVTGGENLLFSLLCMPTVKCQGISDQLVVFIISYPISIFT